jgi:hypothetical protein
MYQQRIQITLQGANDDYYVATQNANNTWTVTTVPTETYLANLPRNWSKLELTWERNMQYMGVFRSMTNNFEFTLDGRAIIMYILSRQGTSGYCKCTLWVLNENGFNYMKFYQSEIDFTNCQDDKVQRVVTVNSLDGRLFMYLKSKINSSFDLPFWTYDGDSWSTDAKFVEHGGIKVLWRANYIGAATVDDPISYSVAAFNGGRFGTLTACGAHTLPALNNYNIVENNGTTTFIGNDILQPVLVADSQPPAANEVNFAETTNYNASKSALLVVKQNIDELQVKLRMSFQSTDIVYFPSSPGFDFYFKVVLFEIEPNGLPPQTIPGKYDIFATLLEINIGYIGSYTLPTQVYETDTIVPNFKAGRVYMLAFIFDGYLFEQDCSNSAIFALNGLDLTIQSQYNSGTASAVYAPSLPLSYIPSFTPMALFSKIMQVFDSTETDQYGFPVANGTGFTAASEFLSDTDANPALLADLVPANLSFTSGNAVRAVNGIPYISCSLDDFYSFFKKTCMCGLGIEDDTITIEPLTYYFDADTEIMDLGSDVANFQTMPLTDIQGNLIKAGFGDLRTNTNFGVDAFSQSVQYNLPLDKTPKEIDLQVTEAVVEIYEIEKMRAQNNSDSGTASSDNPIVVLETVGVSPDEVEVPNPSGDGTELVDIYPLKTYPTAQSTNPLVSPYLYGMYYPDTAYNLGFTPASNIRRNGRLIRTLCDGVGDFGGVVSWRKVYQKQYNDYTSPATTLPGTAKLLNTATVIKEVSDIPITALGSKLFRPYIFKFTSGYPFSMYNLINTNPRGYISFKWNNTEFKGFIYRVSQSIGDSQNTDFELLAHPLTLNSELEIN